MNRRFLSSGTVSLGLALVAGAAAGPAPVALSVLGVLAGACGQAAAQGVTVLPPHSVVEDRTIADWSTRAWRWALAFSAPNDPLTDPTGALANLNQHGPVFFLGGIGTQHKAFSVPSNKYVLVPLVTGELSQLELPPGTTAAQVRAAAIAQANLIDSLHATIDGVPVPNLFQYRELSRNFTFTAAVNNPIGDPVGFSGVAVADGYSLMLAPMPVGTHVINFGGGISAFGFSLDITDTITVVPADDDDDDE